MMYIKENNTGCFNGVIHNNQYNYYNKMCYILDSGIKTCDNDIFEEIINLPIKLCKRPNVYSGLFLYKKSNRRTNKTNDRQKENQYS